MKALIYTKPECKFCDLAKVLLKKYGVEVEEVEVTSKTRNDLILTVEALGFDRPTTVPQIFIDNEYIGGYDKLVVFIKGC